MASSTTTTSITTAMGALLKRCPTPVDTSLAILPRDRSRKRSTTPTQRARSHSPSRRSPKLRHTNGRLDLEPALDQEPPCLHTDLVKLTPSVCRRSLGGSPQTSTPEEPPTGSGEPQRADLRRAMSCRSVKTEPAAQPRRLKIFYRDEAFREKCASNTRRMLASARCVGRDGSNCSNQNLLAMKALKYRKVFDRVKDLDAASLQDPSIDVSKCLGVEWCKV